MSTQSKITHSTHVAPSTMSLFLSPLSGSRWRMVMQISSYESISLSLVLFCLAFRAIPIYPCSIDVATTASRIPVYDPEGRLFTVDILCYLLGYAHHLRLSFKENLRHYSLVHAVSPGRRTRNQFTLLPDFQDRLYSQLTRLVEFVGASGVGERQHGFDHWFQFPCIDEVCDFRQLCRTRGPRQESP